MPGLPHLEVSQLWTWWGWRRLALVDCVGHCEGQLQRERLCVLVPIAEKLALTFVHIIVRDLERYRLVWLARVF